jgi:hypothetical protein
MDNTQWESEQGQGFTPSGQTKFPAFDWLEDSDDDGTMFKERPIETGRWSDTQQPRSADTIPDVRQSQGMTQGVVPCEESNEPGIDWCILLEDNPDHTNERTSAQGTHQSTHDDRGSLLRQQLIAPSHALISTQMLHGPSGEAVSINVTQRPFDTFPGCKSKGGICVISCGIEPESEEGSKRALGMVKFSADFCGGRGFGISEATAKAFEPFAEAVVSLFNSQAKVNQAAYTQGSVDLADQRYQDPTFANRKVAKELATLFQDRYESCNAKDDKESHIPIPPEGMIFLAAHPSTAKFYIDHATQYGDGMKRKPVGEPLWPTLRGIARESYLNNIRSRS